MKNHSRFILFFTVQFLLINVNCFSQAPAWAWAKSAICGGVDGGNSICVDSKGNAYVTGYYINASVNFGGTTLTNAGNDDAFVAKYDSAGNFKWAKNISGILGEYGFGVAVDGSSNVYVTGYFSSPSTIIGSFTLYAGSNMKIFIAKIDSSGNVLWAHSEGGSSDVAVQGITVDTNCNFYLTGYFSGTSISFGSTTLIGNGTGTLFLAKFDSSGSAIWAAGEVNATVGKSISTDANGNVYIAGYFSTPSVTFGSTVLINGDVSGNSSDIFTAKYDSLGNFVWAKSGSGNNNDYGTAISSDAIGNSYVTGRFVSPSVTFGTTTLINAGGVGCNDIFIVKYSPSGNVVWAKREGSNYEDRNNGILADDFGNFYVTGWFYDPTITLGTTVLTNTDITYNSPDIYIAKYDGSGNVLWAKSAQGDSFEGTYGIAVDPNGNSYVTGDFTSSSSSFGTTTLINTGGKDFFIAKLGASCIGFAASICNDTIICPGSSVQLNAGGGLSYEWSPSTGLSATNIPDPIANPLTTTTYTVTVSNNACTATNSVVISVHPPPSLSCLGNGDTVCVFSSGTPLITLSCNGFVNYLWSTSTGETSSVDSIVITNAGIMLGIKTVYLTVTDSNACSNTDSTIIIFISCEYIPEYSENNIISLSPNPFSSSATLHSSKPLNSATLVIYDVLGKEVKRMVNLYGNEIIIRRDGIKDGMFFYSLVDKDGIVGNGKVIIN